MDRGEFSTIEIIKVVDADTFYGRVLSAASVNFKQFHDSLQEQFADSYDYLGRIEKPKKNELYIGRHPRNRQWFRALVLDVMVSSHALQTRCLLVDTAEEVNIETRNLRQAQSKHRQLAYQANYYKLDGLTPVTMASDPITLVVHLQPTDRWDEHTKTFVRKEIQQATVVKVETMNTDNAAGVRYVRLYLTKEDGTEICLNDVLIERKYASGDYSENGLATSLRQQTSPAGSVGSPLRSPTQQHPRLDVRSSNTHQSPYNAASATMNNVTWTPDRKSPLSSPPDRKSPLSSPLSSTNKPASGRARLLQKALAAQKPGGLQTQVNDLTEQKRQSPSVAYNIQPQTMRGDKLQASPVDDPRTYANSPQVCLDDARRLPNNPQACLDDARRLPNSPQACLDDARRYADSPQACLGDSVDSFFRPLKRSARAPQTQESDIPVSGESHAQIDAMVSDARQNNEADKQVRQKRRSIQFSDPECDVVTDRDETFSPQLNASSSVSILKRSPVSGASLYTSGTSSYSGGSDADSAGRSPARKVQLKATYDCSRFLESLPLRDGAIVDDDVVLTPDDAGVFYAGPRAPRPITSFKAVDFGLLFELVANKSDRSPSILQTFAWAPIEKPQDVIGVGGLEQGHTMTYAVALVHSLGTGHADYKPLPKPSLDPRVIVLSPSWRSANAISECFQRTIKLSRFRLKCKLIYGACNDNNNEISMHNGCDVLVATPDCLVRMLERKALSLKRLCHLVLDGADMLCESFTTSLVAVMDFRRRQKDMTLGTPNQILAFSEHWCTALGVFGRLQMDNPTIIITSKTEAAIFGKVKLEPLVCNVNQRVTKVIELCDTVVQSSGKSLIIARDRNAVETLQQHLKHMYVRAVHDEMTEHEMSRVRKEWTANHDPKSPLVLLCTDDVLNQLQITDANVVVHFDPPAKLYLHSSRNKHRQWTMGKRLWCMKQRFLNPLLRKTVEPQARSYLLITASMEDEAVDVRRYLRRTVTSLPPLLNQLAERALEAQDHSKTTPLCGVLKAFGKCKYEWRCRNRHTVFESLDGEGAATANTLTLPKSGVVKVLITCVRTASFYYGRLLEHKPKNGDAVNLSATYTDLYLKLMMAMADTENHQKCYIELNGLYVIKDKSGIYHRVKVTSLSTPGSKGVSERATVFYVDTGRLQRVATEALLELPEQFHTFAYQAVELYACRVKPHDNDLEWIPRSETFMSERIFNRELHGHVVLSLGNCLWLDPLTQKQELSALKTVHDALNVRTELLAERYGEPNTMHLHNLFELCRGRVSLAGTDSREEAGHPAFTNSGMRIVPEVCKLRMPAMTENGQRKTCPEDDWQLAYVTSLEDPNLIYVQTENSKKGLEDMCDMIRMYQRYHDEQPCDVSALKPDTLVVTKYPETNDWYRARVKEVLPDGQLEVFFVDTGETECVDLSDLRPMRSRFMHAPFMAIECQLMHVEPRDQGEGWSEELGDFIWNLVTHSDEPKQVYVKAVRRTTARCTGQYKYGIEIYVSGYEYGVNLAEYLVATQRARVSHEHIQELFSEQQFLEAQGEKFAQVPVLCQHLVQLPAEETSRRTQLAHQVHDLVKQNLRNAAAMVEAGMFGCLCDVIGHVWCAGVTDVIFQAIVHLVVRGSSAISYQRIATFVNHACAILDLYDDVTVQAAIINGLPLIKTYYDSSLTADLTAKLDKMDDAELKKLFDKTADQLSIAEDSPLVPFLDRKLLVDMLDDVDVKGILADQMKDSTAESHWALDSMLSCGVIRILTKIVTNATDVERKTKTLQSLTAILTGLHDSQYVSSNPATLQMLCACLRLDDVNDVTQCTDAVREEALLCVEQLSLHATLKDAIRKQDGINLMCALLESNSQPAAVVAVCVRCLKLLASNNRFNKSRMHELNLPDTLRRLRASNRLDADTLSLCHEFECRLREVRQSAPAKSTVNGNHTNEIKPLSSQELCAMNKAVKKENPQVLWSQDRFNILLTVDAKQVSKNADVLRFTSPFEIVFNAIANSVLYTFTFTLFDLVDTTEFEIDIKSSQVLIGLRKQEHGLWPRLLSSKTRPPPYLKFDHGRLIDISDDDEDENDDTNQERIPRPLSLATRSESVRRPFPVSESTPSYHGVDHFAEDNDDETSSTSSSCEEYADIRDDYH